MKIVFTSFAILLSLISSSQQLFHSPVLEFRNDTAFLRNDLKPYTGTYEVYYDYEEYKGRVLKLKGYFSDGLKKGLFVEYFEDHKLKSQIQYLKGVKHGESFYKYNNSYFRKKEIHVNGNLNGQPAVIKWFDNGLIRELSYYTNDTLDTLITFERENVLAAISVLPFEREGTVIRDSLIKNDTTGVRIAKLIPIRRTGKESYLCDTIYDDSLH